MTLISGEYLTIVPSDSSSSATKCLPQAAFAFVSSSGIIPPTQYDGEKPAFSSTYAHKPLVVVFPWVPEKPMKSGFSVFPSPSEIIFKISER